MNRLIVRLLILAGMAGLVHVPEAQDDPVVLEAAPCYADGPFEPGDYVGTLDAGALSCSGRPRNC
jgi:hypothetical protein